LVNCHGLKAVACFRLLRPLRSDVGAHGGFVRSDELTLKHPPALLRHKYYMVHQAMERASASPENWFGHTFIVSQWAEGFGLSPALKRGACAFSVNVCRKT